MEPFRWPLTQISRSHHYLTNISETVWDKHSYNRILIGTYIHALLEDVISKWFWLWVTLRDLAKRSIQWHETSRGLSELLVLNCAPPVSSNHDIKSKQVARGARNLAGAGRTTAEWNLEQFARQRTVNSADYPSCFKCFSNYCAATWRMPQRQNYDFDVLGAVI